MGYPSGRRGPRGRRCRRRRRRGGWRGMTPPSAPWSSGGRRAGPVWIGRKQEPCFCAGGAWDEGAGGLDADVSPSVGGGEGGGGARLAGPVCSASACITSIASNACSRGRRPPSGSGSKNPEIALSENCQKHVTSLYRHVKKDDVFFLPLGTNNNNVFFRNLDILFG